MNLYFKVIFLIATLLFVFGFAGPYLISADNTELVLGGFALIFVVGIPLWYKLGKSIFVDAKAAIEKLSTKEETQ